MHGRCVHDVRCYGMVQADAPLCSAIGLELLQLSDAKDVTQNHHLARFYDRILIFKRNFWGGQGRVCSFIRGWVAPPVGKGLGLALARRAAAHTCDTP